METLPGVAAPGELHWFREPRTLTGDGFKTRAGWHVDRVCRVCGPSCEVFTGEFAAQHHYPGSLYASVAKRLGVSTMVVSDKLPYWYKTLWRPGMTGIVLYKRPEASVLSDIRNEALELERASRGWARMYGEYLKWADIFCGKVICVAYEDLASRPLETMQALTRKAGLPVPDRISLPKAGYHAIGGNPRAYERMNIKLDERWRTGLTKDQQARITNNSKVRRVLQALEGRRMPIK
jgi:hypothetical protein